MKNLFIFLSLLVALLSGNSANAEEQVPLVVVQNSCWTLHYSWDSISQPEMTGYMESGPAGCFTYSYYENYVAKSANFLCQWTMNQHKNLTHFYVYPYLYPYGGVDYFITYMSPKYLAGRSIQRNAHDLTGTWWATKGCHRP